MATACGLPFPLRCDAASASSQAECSLRQDVPACAAAPSGGESGQQRRWYSVLAELKADDSTSTAPDNVEAVARSLREALDSVLVDEQWNCSGIAELLQRALEMSERGCLRSALKAAVALLDFHKMVEKYRQVVASRTRDSSSSHSTSSGKRHGCDELDADVTEDACGPLKRQRTSSGPDVCASPPQAADDIASEASVLPLRPAEFAVPHLPAKKAQHSSACVHVAAPAPAPPAVATVFQWNGTVTQAVPGGRDVALCKISVPLPVECAKEVTQLSSLEVVQLAPRRNVKLGRHRVCKCTLVEASTAQLAKLKSMAQNELVALAPMENFGLILVPYLDRAGGVRLVSFCLATPYSS